MNNHYHLIIETPDGNLSHERRLRVKSSKFIFKKEIPASADSREFV
jgi:hypothetical protein